MKKTKKRLASILLTLVMAMTLFFAAPMTVYAAAADYTLLSDGGGTTYNSLADAVGAAAATDTITLTTAGDAETLSDTILISGKTITLDLNGNSLTLLSNLGGPAILIQFGSLTVQGGGTLNVNNTTQYGINLYSTSGTSTLTVATGTIVNATGGDAGINVNGAGSIVSCSGTINAIGTDGNGANAQNGGQITIIGNATASGTSGSGAYASGTGSSVTVNNGNAAYTGTGYGYGASADTGGQITVNNGNATAGSATGTGTGSCGAYAESGGQITVNGDATATATGSGGACAESGGQITVNGNASGVYVGALASGDGSTIEVTGSATGANYGAIAEISGKITVGGNSTASTGVGAYSETGGQITIDGTITAPTYITVGTTNKTITQFALSSQKPLYIQYTDNTNYVWVKGVNEPALQHFGTWTGTGTAIGKSPYDPYTGLVVLSLFNNGVQLIEGTDFTKAAGSTVFTLTPAYLGSLANGSYTFRAFFYTAQAPSITYTDLNLVVTNPNAPGAGAGGGANGVPQTDDTYGTLGWMVLLALVILGVFGLLTWRRRHRAQE